METKSAGLEDLSKLARHNSLGGTKSVLKPTIWGTWPPPKCKLFAWLVILNRVWAVDCLEKRGWPNCGTCLFRSEPEADVHLLFTCWFAISMWIMIKDLVGAGERPSKCVEQNARSGEDWWMNNMRPRGSRRKGSPSLPSSCSRNLGS